MLQELSPSKTAKKDSKGMKTKPKGRVLLEATIGNDVPKSPASRNAAIASIEKNVSSLT